MISNRFQQAVAPLDKPWPLRPGTVHPKEKAGELAALRIHPHELDGDALRYWVPRAPEIDQTKDQRLQNLAKIIAECSGIHAAATHLMATEPDWDFMAVYYDAIDHFGHAFMRYHPPRLPWVSEADFDLYKDVIRGGYIYHDLMLGRLLEMAGPDVTVILMSDHGFHPDHLRIQTTPNEPAGPAAEHRQFGIFVAAGPGIRENEPVHGVSLLDITPTILSLFGLPAGRDMDGRILTQIYQNPSPPEFTDSWELLPGEDGRHPPETRLDPVESQEAIRQLVALGYIDEPDADKSKAVEETTRERRYNLALSLVDAGQSLEACAIFSELWERWPDESRFGVKLLQAHMAAGQIAEARITMSQLRERKNATVESASQRLQEKMAKLKESFPAATPAEESEENPVSGGIDWEKVPDNDKRALRRLRGHAGVNPRAFTFLEASLLHLEGRSSEALRELNSVDKWPTAQMPSVLLKTAQLHLSLRQWDEAETSFQNALKLDPLHAQTHYGLARIRFHKRDWKAAADHAADSLEIHYLHAPAHYLAARALIKTGDHKLAQQYLEQALAIQPVYPAAHRVLAVLHLKRGAWDLCAEHLKLSRLARRRAAQTRSQGIPASVHPQEHRDSFGTETDTEPPRSPSPTLLPPREETLMVVTGLPRTGTSMMMQLLRAGGVPVMDDSHRPADESNERGYVEHTLARGLATDNSWLPEAKGKAVKIVAQLLPHLTPDLPCRVIMMHRPLSQVISSQKKMLERLGKAGAALNEDALANAYRRQTAQIRALLQRRRDLGELDILDIKYEDALTSPMDTARRVAEFLSGDFQIEAAAQAIAPHLRHETQRKPVASN